MIRLHNQNRTQTFIDVESGQFISLPKDETDKPPVNADANGLMIYGKTIQDGEPTPDNPVDLVSIPSEFNLTVCGKNLVDLTRGLNSVLTVNNGVYKLEKQSDGARFSAEIPIYIPDNTTFTLSANIHSTNVVYWRKLQYVFGFSDGTYAYGGLEHTFGFASRTYSFTKTIKTIVFYIAGTEDAGAYCSFDNLQIEIGSVATPYQPYLGSTYPYRLEDLDGNLHELCSLPDGTRDEYDRDNGILIKRVKRLAITSGTTSEPNNIVPIYWSSTDTIAGIVWNDNQNKWTHSIGEQNNIRCSHAKHAPTRYSRVPGTCYFNARANDTQLEMLVLKSVITDAGFTLDSAGVRAYVDKIIADTGEPITFLYPYSEPQIIPIKRYGETYNGQVWDKNEKPKSIQYHTNIFTDVGAEMQCEVRKLGNRAMGTFNWVTENGDKIITEDGDYIMLEY